MVTQTLTWTSTIIRQVEVAMWMDRQTGRKTKNIRIYIYILSSLTFVCLINKLMFIYEVQSEKIILCLSNRSVLAPIGTPLLCPTGPGSSTSGHLARSRCT